MRRAVAALLAVAAVVVSRVAVPNEAPVIPMIAIEQGVSSQLVAGTAVFLARAGSTVVAFSPLTPGGRGDRLVYCPSEQIFVSPARRDLFNDQGEHVAGPAPRDMDRFPVQVTQDLDVRVDVDSPIRAKGRSPGKVSGEVGSRYYDWAADPAKPQRFCQNPVRA